MVVEEEEEVWKGYLYTGGWGGVGCVGWEGWWVGVEMKGGSEGGVEVGVEWG